jgi:dipeptide/tripeptide permease
MPCGVLIGGVLYEGLGAALMYRWAGVGMLAGLVLFASASRDLAGSKAKRVVC